MSKHIDNRGNSGFSMVEALAAVAVLVILLSLSAVGVSYYRDLLKITELDNAAREIYMAAENRAVLLGGGGQLDYALGSAVTLSEGGEESSLLCVTQADIKNGAAGDLLTAGAVDPALLDGDFYIIYNRASGAVTDVFYAEQPINNMGETTLDAFFNNWRGRAREDRMRPGSDRPMLGYYGGEHTAREDYRPLPATGVEVMVEIHNDERLTVDVTFKVPDEAWKLMDRMEKNAAQKVTLDYQGTPVTLFDNTSGFMQSPFSDRVKRTGSLASGTLKYTWVLDALEDGKHFRELFSDSSSLVFGNDFTVTAELTLSADGYRPTGATGSDTNNSLFAEHSNGETARLENLRHLQNLDTGTSGAGGKKYAVQLKDICCHGDQAYHDKDTDYRNYAFVPIANTELISFDAGWSTGNERNKLLNLYVTAASADGKAGAGLFAETKGMDFTGVRLINAEIAADASQSAGGLAGTASGVTVINDCWVYWELEGQPHLRSLLVKNAALPDSDPNRYQYKISGNIAGGLVGSYEKAGSATSSKDNVTITNSLAASTIKGTLNAGGLIGSSTAEVIIETSYADCYLAAKNAAGLVTGIISGAKITNCYAAGFINMNIAENAAGLTLGDSAITAKSTYSAMAYPGSSSGKNIYKLAQKQSDSTFTKTYYLGSESESSTDPNATSYDEMSSIATFATSLGGGAFSSTRKGSPIPADGEKNHTYPYNLQEKQNLDAYRFPGLKNLPHYGDWQAYFKEPSLVYYEYQKNKEPKEGDMERLAFSGGNARTLSIGDLDTEHKNREVIVSDDGYAVALLQSDLNTSSAINELTITYTYLKIAENGTQAVDHKAVTYQRADFKEATWTREDGTKEEYYLLFLPDELVIGADSIKTQPLKNRTTKNYYQYLRFEIKEKLNSTNQESPSGEFFYNPHFAETVRPYVPVDDKPLVDWEADAAKGPAQINQYITQTLAPQGRTLSVQVRSPRHLYDLSFYEDYYNNDERNLSFRQELDLDYKKYTGYGFQDLANTTYIDQAPIGTQTAPFRGIYNGGYHTIEHVIFRIEGTSRVCMGLFGCSGGDLRNIVYKLDPEVTIPRVFQGKEAYFGSLAGINGGTITNCAVEGANFKVSAYDSTLYIGGLAGVNQGTITNSAVELASLSVEASLHLPAYAGGVAGWNTSTASILKSYVVGRLSAKAEESSTPISLCGFVSRNQGTIRDSYSAVDLRADGAGATAYGFCDPADGVGRQTNAFYLNRGNFTYRKAYFLADFDRVTKEPASPNPKTYAELTNPEKVDWMSMYPRPVGEELSDDVFPYPTGVTDRDGNPVHYGQWPKPMDLGDMGVYYWEELRTGGKTTYHVSLLAVDPGENKNAEKTVSKISTLRDTHDSGGVVQRYGYGFYSKILGKNENGQDQAIELTLESKDLLYSTDAAEGEEFSTWYANKKDESKSDEAVDEMLEALMSEPLGGLFKFHSFPSYVLDYEKDTKKSGLYPSGADAKTGEKNDKPNAKLTLEQSGKQTVKVTFLLNPHFADALAMKEPDTGTWKAEDNAPLIKKDASEEDLAKLLPGGASNPYEVRSIEQLQMINWNRVNRNTNTVVTCTAGNVKSNISEFPYLSSGAATGKYNWQQTFDIKGAEGVKYSPIAEYYDSTNTNGNAGTNNTGTLEGWFSGVYDGGGYLIENVDIQGGLSSCAGLFGIVYNGTLKNITLYSSSGLSTVKRGGDEKTAEDTKSQWYAIGALAGVAASHDANGNPSSSAIQNCVVSGYRIEALTYTDGDANLWGGTGVGGLLGLSNMNLTGCSAVTDIQLVDGSTLYDNMRVGGLVGSCQGTIQNCYAGGEIKVGSSVGATGGKDIYIGGLVGGSYMKPLQIAGTKYLVGSSGGGGLETGKAANDTNNTLQNCYSYVKLPAVSGTQANSKIKGLFLLGGVGELYSVEEVNNDRTLPDSRNHGFCTIENCYVLTSEVLSNNDGIDGYQTAVRNKNLKTDLNSKYGYGSPVAVTYEQLSGSAKIGDYTIYQLLNDKRGPNAGGAEKAGPFYSVSDTEIDTNISVPGKYSYPPSTSPELAGLNYPFPTVLKKETDEGTYHVHYGRWPLHGFSRVAFNKDGDKDVSLGTTPILIDLFGAKVYQERLVLTSANLAGGDWKIEGGYREVDTERNEVWYLPDKDGESARVTIKPAGDSTMKDATEFILTVTGVSEGTHGMKITYTKGGIPYSVPVSVHVSAGVQLQPSTIFLFPDDAVTVNMAAANSAGQALGGTLELKDVANTPEFLTAQAVQLEGESVRRALRFSATGAPQETTTLSAEFTYTTASDNPGEPGKAYQSFSPIQVQILPLPEMKFTGPGEGEEMGGKTTITFSDHPFGESDTLHFQIVEGSVRVKNSDDFGEAPPTLEVDKATGTITLTYPKDLREDAPAVELAVTLTVTSENPVLIPEEQTHEVTLKVSKPAEDQTETETMALPDALPPEEEPSDNRARRRRARKRES